MDQVQYIRWVLKPAIFVAALVPLGLLVYDGFTGGLGANPIQDITFRTGLWTLRFLVFTLCVTPLRRLSGWNALVRVRRMLGLYAFFYACLHFTTYFWLDQEFDWPAIVADVVKRPYITVGFSTFLLLIPLAATSTNAMVRRLGGQRWRRLHQIVYVAAMGGVLHFLWLVKADTRQPLFYLIVLCALFALRLPLVSGWLSAAQPLARMRGLTASVRGMS